MHNWPATLRDFARRQGNRPGQNIGRCFSPRDSQQTPGPPPSEKDIEVKKSIGCNLCHVETILTAPAGTIINGGAYVVSVVADLRRRSRLRLANAKLSESPSGYALLVDCRVGTCQSPQRVGLSHPRLVTGEGRAAWEETDKHLFGPPG